jgi:GT2 family glycosyltransferase
LTGPTVYIPNLDGGDRLLDALASLEAQSSPAKVVVIDNGSSDGSPARVRERFPGVELIELGSNLGFGRALNEGVRRAPGDPVIFVNNDCVCEPQLIEAFLDEAAPGASVAGVLLRGDDPGRIDSAGVEADVTLLALEHLLGEPAAAAESAPAPLGPSGGAALYSLEMFNLAGGFDERIFAYLEDVDLALRLATAGHGCRLAPAARAIHAHSATLGSGSRAKNELMGFARGYMLGRYRVLGSPARALRALACEATICAGQAAIDRTVSGLPSRVRGFRLGRSLPARPVPEAVLSQGSTAEVLRRRSLRRRDAPPVSV